MSERLPLSRARIAAAALAFIDEHGTAALSMRKLGSELGVEAMSLYNHVANKDDLLDAVTDLIYREALDGYEPDPASSWQDDARRLADAFRATAHRHPEALDLLTARDIPSTVKMAFLQACYDVFARAGFSVKDAALAFDTTVSWVVGALRQELGIMKAIADGPSADRDQLPAELADFSDACRAWTPDQRFAFGLDTLVAGLELRLHR